MDAHKMIEDDSEKKVEVSLKEALRQEDKIKQTSIDIKDIKTEPGSNTNEKHRQVGLEDIDFQEKRYEVEITDTEASDGLLFEEVATLVRNAFIFLFFLTFVQYFFCFMQVFLLSGNFGFLLISVVNPSSLLLMSELQKHSKSYIMVLTKQNFCAV